MSQTDIDSIRDVDCLENSVSPESGVQESTLLPAIIWLGGMAGIWEFLTIVP